MHGFAGFIDDIMKPRSWLVVLAVLNTWTACAAINITYGVVEAIGDMTCLPECYLVLDGGGENVTSPLEPHNTVAWPAGPVDDVWAVNFCDVGGWSAAWLDVTETKAGTKACNGSYIPVMTYALQRRAPAFPVDTPATFCQPRMRRPDTLTISIGLILCTCLSLFLFFFFCAFL